MTVLNLSTHRAADFIADAFCMNSENTTEAKMIGRYNVLAIAFDSATVMLVSAVATAVLGALSTALVLGGVGLAVRSIAWHGINGRDNGADWEEASAQRRMLEKAQSAKWKPVAVNLLDYELWFNLLPSNPPARKEAPSLYREQRATVPAYATVAASARGGSW